MSLMHLVGKLKKKDMFCLKKKEFFTTENEIANFTKT